MRKLKFRYWNGSKVLPQEAIINHLNKYIARSDEHLMQFTGLLDKNGKEVYDRDIVKILGNIAEVSMINSSWCYQRVDNYNIQPLGDFSSSSYEVIGNIYENKDLLDDKSKDE